MNDHPDEQQPHYARRETEAERLDRNYNELLQELRVSQTGVQILFAFLLGIAFQQRFSSITSFQRAVYVITMVFATLATIQLIAPVAIHRMIFRLRRKDDLVRITNRLAIGGLTSLMFAVLGAVLLVLDYVLSAVGAFTIVGCLAILFAWLWVALPLRERNRHQNNGPPEHGPPEHSPSEHGPGSGDRGGRDHPRD
jgi:hypothetical protein